jgi:hypothetical protein
LPGPALRRRTNATATRTEKKATNVAAEASKMSDIVIDANESAFETAPLAC